MTDLRIATIQTALHWEDIGANLGMIDRLTDSITDVDLVVLPEMFSTGFSMVPVRLAEAMDGRAVGWMRQAAARKNCVITGSLMLYEDDGQDRKYYNRLIWMRPDGSLESYDKKHLFSLSDEPKIYTAGAERLIVTLQGWRICPMICYDLRFPVWSRNAINDQREAAYDLLIYSACWPDRRALAWKTLLQARAIENQTYVIGVNRVGEDGAGMLYQGDTSVIDPLGNIIYRREKDADVFTTSLSYSELVKVRRQFQFLRDADPFQLL
ncbi:MAG: amidohydrolase [Bacteroidetes bacterium]|nr:amidohydrolase [Bacteroidota bacterium]